MNTDCALVRDLLPLYLENMVSEESAAFVAAHLKVCPACQREWEALQETLPLPADAKSSGTGHPAPPLQKLLKRLNRKFYALSYAIIIFFVLFGFGLTNGSNVLYNSLIMPAVGVFGYVVFRWRAIYQLPLLLLIIDLAAYLLGMVELELASVLLWSLLYALFALVGVAITALLHFAFKKE